MKLVNDVLAKAKGGVEKVKDTLTGKGSFSKQGFADLTSALVNDTTFNVHMVDKDGKDVKVNVSALIREDLKKTVAAAKYPQKSEAGVLDTCEIHASGLATAIPFIIMEQIRSGKKFDLPEQKEMKGSIYLAPVKGKVREVKVRDMKTGEDRGTTVITTQDSVQIRAKSPVPARLQKKVRKP